MKLIDKDRLVAKINKLKEHFVNERDDFEKGYHSSLNAVSDYLDSLEVKDPYEECIQYSSIEDGIRAHAEIYSFNIESELFNQLTKEQQALWRKEIEQACISGGNAGVGLARDIRYKENTEVKEMDLEKEMSEYFVEHPDEFFSDKYKLFAKHFYELGLNVKKGNEIVEAFKSGWDAAIEKVIKKACNGFEDLQKYLTINVELNKLIEGFRNSVEKE